MKVDDEIGNALRGQSADDPANQRHAIHRECCLRTKIGEGAEPGTQTGGKYQGAHESKSMSAPFRPNFSRRCRNRLL